MMIAVFGANGPTGRILTRQALAEGHQVTAFTRRPSAFPQLPGSLRVLGGDVTDPDAVAAAVDGQDAVVSTLGAPFGRRPVTVYSIGVDHITRAMDLSGVSRFVCVSSTTLSPHPDQEGGHRHNRPVHLPVEVAHQPEYDGLQVGPGHGHQQGHERP